MTKGHNKDLHNDLNNNTGNKAKEQSGKLPESKGDKQKQGRHSNPDQSGGTKGPNSI